MNTAMGTGPADDAWTRSYDYRAPMFDFECRLIYDQYGLVLDYPGIAIRAGWPVGWATRTDHPFRCGTDEQVDHWSGRTDRRLRVA